MERRVLVAEARNEKTESTEWLEDKYRDMDMRALDAGKKTLDAERKLAVLEEARLRGKVEEAAKVQPLTGIMIPAGSGYGGCDKGKIEGVESFTGLLRLPFGRDIRVGGVIMTTYMHE
ncbi:hypothetical protein QC762_0071190 [Podospora pseudocomata]|uniref:Uncharacterized protein n=1 Tax=Podospora pseudocomata TaxID=2093779 RepID=A0ABR0GGT1_9PEZI|nr:hypothetical protein QC762_0071190 [Podospora pseudocomata]